MNMHVMDVLERANEQREPAPKPTLCKLCKCSEKVCNSHSCPVWKEKSNH